MKTIIRSPSSIIIQFAFHGRRTYFTVALPFAITGMS